MTHSNYAKYAPAEPYFNVVREAMGDLVDGEHFFDIVAPDIIYEVRYEFPGWPRITSGRADLMAMFASYVQNIALNSTSDLVTMRAENGQVVVLEYEVHGTILSTGRAYHNRFCSIATISDRKIVQWRDYMDSLAAWNALSA
ncbi:nuclear transport factor 2 family protein [Novosphingobium sp. FSW06-99]|uniref:nuclear transport factor 2 family protein n=1 Tax=Novosphingobium sp. FSW06-99 TaxID=1739113 RepID=UPI00076D0909|nr:nuclear transport factor 2 family protein [Novosphingobium sp. FSW06-99]KUR79059.1 limonene-1,2-epoxide hydrolase [Novosphingobium sp. FSW06-99]